MFYKKSNAYPTNHVKFIWQSIKQHPVPYVSLLIYLLICYRAVKSEMDLQMQMKTYPERSGIANGSEAVGMLGMLIYFVGFAFLLACIVRGSSKSGDSTFYLWLALALMIVMTIAGNASEFR